MIQFLCKALYRAAYGIAVLLAVLGAYHLILILFVQSEQPNNELGVGIVFIFWAAGVAWLAGCGFQYVLKTKKGRRRIATDHLKGT
jgi:hypothetical protein